MFSNRGREAETAGGEVAALEPLNPREIRREVIRLSGPALTEMLSLTLMSVINMMMVGRLGPASISAVGLSNQPFFLMNAIFVALNVGATALVARNVGANRLLEARNYARQSIMMTIPLGLVLSVLAVYLAPRIIHFMGGRGETLRLGSIYFAIVGSSLVLLSLTVAITSVMRGAGDTRTPMKISIIGNFLVVVFGWLLIYGNIGFPAMGVTGAATAFFLSRLIMVILALWAISKHGTSVQVSLRGSFKPDWKAVKETLDIGLPSAIEQFILQGGLILFVRIVAGLGTEVYAAHQIVLNILGLSFLPGQAFSIAATTLVGQYLGAERPDMAELSVRETRKIGLSITTFVAVAFFTLGELFIGLYTPDPGVVRLGASALKIVALIVPGQTSLLITVGGLRGAGDTRYPLYVSAIGIWIVRLGLARILIDSFDYGLLGAWWATAADQYIRSLLIGLRFRTGRWKTILAPNPSPRRRSVTCH